MSTSTGPAYRLKAGTNIFSIPYEIEEVREEQQKAVIQAFLDVATSSFFVQCVQDGEPVSFNEMIKNVSVKLSGDSKLLDEEKSEQYFLTKLMLGSVLFHYNPVRDETYVRLINFSDKADYLFSKLPFVDKDMKYYNGSDSQLEHMSEGEWADLQKCWNEVETRKVFLHPTVPQVELFHTSHIKSSFLTFAAVNKYFPQLELRSGNEQLSEVFKLKMNKAHSVPIAPGDKDLSELWARVSTIARYQFDDDNREIFVDMPEILNKVDAVRDETFKWVTDNPLVFVRN